MNCPEPTWTILEEKKTKMHEDEKIILCLVQWDTRKEFATWRYQPAKDYRYSGEYFDNLRDALESFDSRN